MDNKLFSTSILGLGLIIISILCILFILIVIFTIISLRMLKYELKIMIYGKYKEMQIVDVNNYNDNNTFYDTVITLCDKDGHLAIAKMITGLMYYSPIDCWQIGTKVNAKVIGGEAVLE